MRYSLITINSNEKGLESLRTRIKIGVNILCVVSISNIIILVYNISQAGVREQTSYENLITIILTALAVILTVMTVGLAIFSYYGYHKVIEIIENTVGERVEGLVKDYVDEYYVKNQPGTIMDKLNQIKDDDV